MTEMNMDGLNPCHESILMIANDCTPQTQQTLDCFESESTRKETQPSAKEAFPLQGVIYNKSFDDREAQQGCHYPEIKVTYDHQSFLETGKFKGLSLEIKTSGLYGVPNSSNSADILPMIEIEVQCPEVARRKRSLPTPYSVDKKRHRVSQPEQDSFSQQSFSTIPDNHGRKQRGQEVPCQPNPFCQNVHDNGACPQQTVTDTNSQTLPCSRTEGFFPRPLPCALNSSTCSDPCCTQQDTQLSTLQDKQNSREGRSFNYAQNGNSIPHSEAKKGPPYTTKGESQKTKAKNLNNIYGRRDNKRQGKDGLVSQIKVERSPLSIGVSSFDPRFKSDTSVTHLKIFPVNDGFHIHVQDQNLAQNEKTKSLSLPSEQSNSEGKSVASYSSYQREVKTPRALPRRGPIAPIKQAPSPREEVVRPCPPTQPTAESNIHATHGKQKAREQQLRRPRQPPSGLTLQAINKTKSPRIDKMPCEMKISSEPRSEDPPHAEASHSLNHEENVELQKFREAESSLNSETVKASDLVSKDTQVSGERKADTCEASSQAEACDPWLHVSKEAFLKGFPPRLMGFERIPHYTQSRSPFEFGSLCTKTLSPISVCLPYEDSERPQSTLTGSSFNIETVESPDHVTIERIARVSDDSSCSETRHKPPEHKIEKSQGLSKVANVNHPKQAASSKVFACEETSKVKVPGIKVSCQDTICLSDPWKSSHVNAFERCPQNEDLDKQDLDDQVAKICQRLSKFPCEGKTSYCYFAHSGQPNREMSTLRKENILFTNAPKPFTDLKTSISKSFEQITSNFANSAKAITRDGGFKTIQSFNNITHDANLWDPFGKSPGPGVDKYHCSASSELKQGDCQPIQMRKASIENFSLLHKDSKCVVNEKEQKQPSDKSSNPTEKPVLDVPFSTHGLSALTNRETSDLKLRLLPQETAAHEQSPSEREPFGSSTCLPYGNKLQSVDDITRRHSRTSISCISHSQAIPNATTYQSPHVSTNPFETNLEEKISTKQTVKPPLKTSAEMRDIPKKPTRRKVDKAVNFPSRSDISVTLSRNNQDDDPCVCAEWEGAPQSGELQKSPFDASYEYKSDKNHIESDTALTSKTGLKTSRRKPRSTGGARTPSPTYAMTSRRKSQETRRQFSQKTVHRKSSEKSSGTVDQK